MDIEERIKDIKEKKYLFEICKKCGLVKEDHFGFWRITHCVFKGNGKYQDSYEKQLRLLQQERNSSKTVSAKSEDKDGL